MKTEKRSGLTKVLGRTDIIALGFGTMIGWSWVVLATTWLTAAGFFGTIIAFAMGVTIILLIGAAYGELTAALPLSGGELVYAYRVGGTGFAWVVGWTMALAYLGVAAWEGIAMASAMDYLLPLPDLIHIWDIADDSVYLSWALVGSAGGLVMLILNLFGTRPAIIFQVMATIAIFAVGIMMLLGGVAFGSIDNIGEKFTNMQGVFYVLLLLPSMLIGFDVIPQSAEEMNISQKQIGRMLIVCIVITSVWYLIIIIGMGLGAPTEVRASGELPAADVFAWIYGSKSFAGILVVVGILGIMTSWNGFFMGATRLIFAMGRAKMLPSVFGKTGRKYRTPWAATWVVGIVCICSPFFGQNALIWLVNMSSLCALFTYCCVTFSFAVLKKVEPSLNRPFNVKGGFGMGIFVFLMSVVYLGIYIYQIFNGGISFHELLVVSIWFIFGVLMYIISRKRHGKISRVEKEHLIFGDKFARFTKEEDKHNE